MSAGSLAGVFPVLTVGALLCSMPVVTRPAGPQGTWGGAAISGPGSCDHKATSLGRSAFSGPFRAPEKSAARPALGRLSADID
jgi:hypothetical protein